MSGSGRFLQAIQEPRIFEMVQKYNNEHTEIERTITGGWALFVIKEA